MRRRPAGDGTCDSRRLRTRHLLLCGALALFPLWSPNAIGAEEAPHAASFSDFEVLPTPEGLAAGDVAAAGRAIARLEAALIAPPKWDATAVPLAWLRLLGEAGFHAAAEALRRIDGTRPGDLLRMRALVAAIASYESPQAAPWLLRALEFDDPVIRQVGADGLGLHDGVGTAALVRAAGDATTAVSLAALRALFARTDDEAREARMTLPMPAHERTWATRLRWHARAGDWGPRLGTLVDATWRGSTHPESRLAAAALLARHAAEFPPDYLQDLVAGLAQPLAGDEQDDASQRRRIQVQIVLALLGRTDVEPHVREATLELALDWAATPLRRDSHRRDPAPEAALLQALPDLAPDLGPPTMRRLLAERFHEPRVGTVLLRELGPTSALPELRALATYALLAPKKRTALLSAATGTLADLGAIGDADLARRLFFDAELAPYVRGDMGEILARDPGAWVVPLLAVAVAASDPELRDEARRALERRKEPEAATLRVETFFRDPARHPHDRLKALVEPADEAALAVLERALGEDRPGIRLVALEQISLRAKTLHRAEVLELVRPLGDRVVYPREIQAYVVALLILAPLEAVEWVRARFASLPDDDVRFQVLRQLKDTRTRKAREAAIDLAFDLLATMPSLPRIETAVAEILHDQWTYRRDEVEAFWRRLLAPGHSLRTGALQHLRHPNVPDFSALLLEHLREIDAGMDSSSMAAENLRERIVEALGHQPWSKVRLALLAVATSPHRTDTTRTTAIKHMIGRLDPEIRATLMRWVGWLEPENAPAEPDADRPLAGAGRYEQHHMHWMLAQAVGAGAEPAIADALFAGLERELAAWLAAQTQRHASPEERLSAERAVEESEGRIKALARGIAETRCHASIVKMLKLIYDGRLGSFARLRLESLRPLRWQGREAPGEAQRLSMVTVRGDYDLRLVSGVPSPAAEVLAQAKVLADDVLANHLTVTLEAARRSGALAEHPDAFFVMGTAHLLDPPTGRRPRSAAVLHAVATALSPPGGGIDRVATLQVLDEHIIGRRFAAAAELAKRDVRRLAMRQVDDEAADPLEWARFHTLALEAAASAQAGQPEDARRLGRAALAVPQSPRPMHLNTIAWYMRETGLDLEDAEGLARRATLLEARLDARSTLSSVDTLAMVLVDRGSPAEAWRIMNARIQSSESRRTGIYHAHMAEIAAALGLEAECERWLVEALRRDPAAFEEWSLAPWLAAVGGAELAKRARARAERDRFED